MEIKKEDIEIKKDIAEVEEPNGVLTSEEETFCLSGDDTDISEEVEIKKPARSPRSLLETPADVIEVEDEDLGDVLSSEEAYQAEQEQKRIDSKVLDAVDSNMTEIRTSMNDVILKQAQVLEKNADSMQSMQENLTTVIKSQSEMVSSISRAIDNRFNQQDKYVSGLVEEKIETKVDEVVYDAVTRPIDKQNKKRRRKKILNFLWGTVKFALVALVCLSLYSNEAIRVRIGLVATDVKEIVVGIINGEEVSSNKLIRDLGIKLNKINTVYYDENNNEITAEEYFNLLNGQETQIDENINE